MTILTEYVTNLVRSGGADLTQRQLAVRVLVELACRRMRQGASFLEVAGEMERWVEKHEHKTATTQKDEA